ncbi:MAG: ParB/RepB/Spo0J family partition protein [Myxococcota bacterium]|nr:ParB/RepB/Spo0J family partition protein [Myxococcota bacterium]
MSGSKKQRLGRGLEALLGPTTVAEARDAGTLREVSVEAIEPNPFQPRHTFDQAAIDDLANSLRNSGLLQPVVLRPMHAGTYQLIAGERRWRAAKQLGWQTIGAVLRDVDDRTLLTLALVENLQRDQLTAIDEAVGYRRLADEFGLPHSEIGRLVGRDRSTVANSLRLLNLPGSVQEMVQSGALQMGHARALLQLTNAADMERLAKKVVAGGLSVRETESRARGAVPPENRRPRTKKTQKQQQRISPEAQRIVEALRRYLKTDVIVTEKENGGGRLAIDFYSNDDLVRVLELVLGERFNG